MPTGSRSTENLSKRLLAGYWRWKNLMIMKFSINLIIPRRNNPLRTKSYQPTASLLSKDTVEGISSHLGMTCGQHVTSRSRCELSRPELPLKISSYANSTRWWVSTDSIYWPKITTALGIKTNSLNLFILIFHSCLPFHPHSSTYI